MHDQSMNTETRTGDVSRRRFLQTTAYGALGALAADQFGTRPAQAAKDDPTTAPSSRRFKYVGWQVGVTYQSQSPGGMSRDDMMRMLDEMARHRMNLLSLQMISYAHFDPKHDGYSWPVTNPKLKPFCDTTAINAQPKTEFVREAIQAAADRGIQVQMIMNWGIWNPDKLREHYSELANYTSRPKPGDPPPKPTWFFCPDAPGSWQVGLDEIADLLGFYKNPNLTSYAFENLCSHDCHCRYTQKAYQKETGKSLMETTELDDRLAWARKHISELLTTYVKHIRSIRPKLDVWLHTSCAAKDWGHDPKRLPGCGFNYLLPHATFHFPITKERFYARLQMLQPNKCVLHFSARDIRPTNYRLWIQTPESIAEKVGWVLDYPGDNLAGVLFYNPNAMSPRNIKTVYEQIKRFDS